MSLRVDVALGLGSILAPVLCFVADSHMPVHEDEFGVDHYAIAHFMLIHTLVLLVGAVAGIYAGVRSSKVWYAATGANVMIWALYAIMGNSF